MLRFGLVRISLSHAVYSSLSDISFIKLICKAVSRKEQCLKRNSKKPSLFSRVSLITRALKM